MRPLRYNSNCMLRRLLVFAIILAIPIFPGGQGKQTVTTSGVPVQLCASCQSKITTCTITALPTNSGLVWVGFTKGVSAASNFGTPIGPPITAGQPGGSYWCNPGGNAQIWSISNIWIDVANSGEGVSFSWN